MITNESSSTKNEWDNQSVTTQQATGFACRLFRLEAGDCLCVRGDNGSGKTTLLRQLAGLKHPAFDLSLQRLWHGRPIRDPDPLFQQNILWLGHQQGLDPATTIAEEWQFWQKLLDDQRTALTRIAGKLKLDKPLDTRISALSAGEKQKVSLGRLAIGHHRLWILDEPDSHLDQQSRRRLAEMIQLFCTQGGMVIVASHQREITQCANLHHDLS